MSLIALRSQIKQLQTEIADLQTRKRMLIDERFARQELEAFQRRSGVRTVGYQSRPDFQAAALEQDLIDADASLVRKQDELQRTQLAWIEYLSRLPERIVVLFFAANPLKERPLRLDEEARAIAERIKKARHRDAVRLESCWAVRPMDVIEGINEHRPRIVHFSGHGMPEHIIFQNSAGQAQPVSKDAIVQAMKASGGDLQLVFFNTCYSRDQAQAVVKHVSAAIGMNTAIGDNAAIVFAAQFYSTIGYGHSVKRAFEQARAALMMEGIRQEDTPELFVAEGLSADDIILVRPADIGET